MTIYLTADTHFGYFPGEYFCGRPFYHKAEHDRIIIARWNSVVKKSDTVYHLGDFGSGDPTILMNKFAGKLKGKICLIKGNHDGPATQEPCSKRFDLIKEVHIISPKINGKTIRLFLSHYPHRSWFLSNHGSYHAYGHTHGNLPPYGLSMDVGVDCHNFTPISLEAFVNFLDEYDRRVKEAAKDASK